MARLTVLKRLLPGATLEQRERFEREARLSLGMRHPAIAQTFDVELIDDELCILQEYVPGFTLSLVADRAEQGQLRPDLAIHVASEVARALAYLHQFRDGIVHRDVTPDNIILSFDGIVKLVDFGIAKTMGDQTALTTVGELVGRPAFAAPEVLAGGKATPRADIFSLGVVMWRVLAGRPLIPARVIHPPSKFNGECISELDAIVLRALAVDPNDRFCDAAELHVALKKLLPAGYFAEQALGAYLRSHFLAAKERIGLDEDVAALLLRIQKEPAKTIQLALPQVVRQGRAVWKTVVPAFAAGVVLTTVAVGAQFQSSPTGKAVPQANPSTLPTIRADVGSTAGASVAGRATSAPPAFGTPAVLSTGTDVKPAPHMSDEQLGAPEPAFTAPAQRTRSRRTATSSFPKLQSEQGKASENVDSAHLLAGARELVAHGDYARAESLANRALFLGAGPEAHLLLGIVNEGQGHFEEAERQYKLAPGAEAEQHLVEVGRIRARAQLGALQ